MVSGVKGGGLGFLLLQPFILHLSSSIIFKPDCQFLIQTFNFSQVWSAPFILDSSKTSSKWEIAWSWCPCSGFLGMAPGCHQGRGLCAWPLLWFLPPQLFAACGSHRELGKEGWLGWEHLGQTSWGSRAEQTWGARLGDQPGYTCPADPLALLMACLPSAGHRDWCPQAGTKLSLG